MDEGCPHPSARPRIGWYEKPGRGGPSGGDSPPAQSGGGYIQNAEHPIFPRGNTPSGFYSLYHQLSDPERFRALYIIKSGPGSGKSTLMRRVERHAQAAGLETEEVLCSGDPDSLDAVIIPALGAAVVDGTAPQGVVP